MRVPSFQVFTIEPGDVLPGGGPTPPTPTPDPPVVTVPRGTKCDFCECVLAEDGHVVQRGKRAGVYLDQDRVIVSLKETIDRQAGELADKDREIADLKAAQKPKGFWG